MRKVILDTETTGLDPAQGHRIIEIGCVEMVGRKLTGRRYHQYINPERLIDAGAMAVHGISNEDVLDKPVFANIVEAFLRFVDGAELVIHNAPFDTGFINSEISRVRGVPFAIADICKITDTLVMARERHPGQKNNLDALCKRYEVDNSHRELHGALLDAEILADVYLAMTGGQTSLALGAQGAGDVTAANHAVDKERRVVDPALAARLPIFFADSAERLAHETLLVGLRKKAGVCIWNAES